MIAPYSSVAVIASEHRERGNPAHPCIVVPGWIASSATPPRNDQKFFYLFSFLIFFIFLISACPASALEHWAVYYSDTLKPAAFAPYDLIVLDSDAHPPLPPLHEQRKVVLGYLSLGEGESFRSYYKDLAAKGLLLSANPQWKDHRVVDIRKPEWAQYMTDVLIPATLAQGFDGVMLDTIDSPLQLEADNPKRYSGMRAAAVQLIKTIRARYPHIKIMLNRGFLLLNDVAGDIDMVMAESICSDWQPGSSKPALLSGADRAYYVNALKSAQRKSSALKVYTIDYWPPKDKNGVKRIYSLQRREGFIPYVSTLSLQTLSPEPQ